MIKLLPKLFIKNYQNISDPKIRNNYGKLSGIVGIITNILLGTLKLISGLLIGSIAIVADGLNNLSDTASSLVTLIGFKMASMPADKNHPFGHQRVEYVSGLLISFFILIIGGSLFKSSLTKVINPEPVKSSVLIIIMLILSILIKFWQSRFYRYNGMLINSRTLLATSVDSFNDVLATTFILISIIISAYSKINLDGYMGLAVSVFIIISGIKLIKETASLLIGEAPSQDLINNITIDIKTFEGVLGIHDLVIHSYGPGKVFATIHVEVDCMENVIISHNLIDKIERYIKEKYNVNLVIHMDPININDEYTNNIKTLVCSILKGIDQKLDFHDFHLIKGKTNEKVIFDIEVPQNFNITENEIIEKLETELFKKNPKFKLMINFDEIFYE